MSLFYPKYHNKSFLDTSVSIHLKIMALITNLTMYTSYIHNDVSKCIFAKSNL